MSTTEERTSSSWLWTTPLESSSRSTWPGAP
jgi:hypothetical protein